MSTGGGAQDHAAGGEARGEHPFRYTSALADEIERRWQAHWERSGTFAAPNPGEPGFDGTKPKFYCLDMFPYPSGAGLHVGHPEGYTATDIVSRYMRMRGCNVLHPMGWDAFGLPAEQYAIQTGVHPAETTRRAIDTFRRQLKRFGFSYDWAREFATIDESYYRWTQWIFLRIYNAWYDPVADAARPIGELERALERGAYAIGPAGNLVASPEGGGSLGPLDGRAPGLRLWHELTPGERRRVIDNQRLAYVDEQVVNWCPRLGTALANEEVLDGKSERGGYPVFRRPLRQWMFRITAYADRLLRDLEGLDWPSSTRAMQADWIGRSAGAEIDFELLGTDERGVESEQAAVELGAGAGSSLRVFTTRPDTVFGATYMVVAPEHPLVDWALARGAPGTDAGALRAYVERARNRLEVERQESKEKTGVFTGVRARNPATGEAIPVWTADYVLMGYGHGAIMAVPAHDERDYEFAAQFGLPIRDVVYPRTVAAMAHFARHCPAELEAGERWLSALADFLGIVTSMNATPGAFPELLAQVLGRREPAEQGMALAVDFGSCAVDLPGAVGERRGATRIVWLDALEALGIGTLAGLRTRFARAEFYASNGEAWSGEGYAVNSSRAELSLDGETSARARELVTEWLESTMAGRRRVNYRLRDWLFSRQRYWGEPFPIVYDAQGNHYPVREDALPVRLPALADYAPEESDEPRPLLAKVSSWVHTTAGEAGVDPALLPPETPVRRETNTMPGWAGSCWYYLRYCDPRNTERPFGGPAEAYWMAGPTPSTSGAEPAGGRRLGGVDLYIGGAEHAVLHLLYARFWHKVLFDLGDVSTPEPAQRLFHQGMITSYAYERADRSLVPADEVEESADGVHLERGTGAPVTRVVAKMSKSLKNVVNPDDVIAEFGADTFRLYEMYMGPLAASKPWNPRDITGCFRFLQRAWRLAVDEQTGALRLADSRDDGVERALHRTGARVAHDIERLQCNTAIAALIEFVNLATQSGGGGGRLTRDQLERFALVLAPMAPHMAEELWSRLGHDASLAHEAWPAVDPAMLRDDAVEMPVQVLGKVRAKIFVPPDADAAAVEAAAMADEKVRAHLQGKSIKKVIVVPGKLINFVTG